MEHLRYFEGEGKIKYKIGDYVVIDLTHWIDGSYNVKITDHVIGGKNIKSYTSIGFKDDEMDNFRFLEYDIIRHMTEEEIVEFQLLEQTNKYNL